MTNPLLARENRQKNSSYFISISIIGIFFFIFGFVTWLNSVLIPFLKIACEKNNFESYFVAFAFYISYFVMAIPSSWVLHKLGFKNGMSLGLILMALGALIFIPAAYSRMFGLFLTGLFIQGTGLAVLQTASNPYVTILGPIESAAKRISIMGICNKIAGVISPIILGAIVLKGMDQFDKTILDSMDAVARTTALNALAGRIIVPYVVMAVVLVVLAILLRYSPLPDLDTDTEDASTSAANTGKKSIFDFPQLVLGVVAIFVYVGVEVVAVDTIINYGKSQGFPFESAKYFASYTLAAMVIGYIIGIITIPKYLKQEQSLMISAVSGIVFSLLAVVTARMQISGTLMIGALSLPFDLSVFFIALLGLSNAVMWPAIWPLAIDGLGRFTKIGSSLLIMGIAGGALIPLLYGYLVDISAPHLAYWITIPCYLFIFYFAFAGHKLRSWNK
ncbi:MAG TPA: glucose/galactose MFS transporter [Bacteroidales bacterium]|nr:glucose/galactose MFS transporter [Bacteroidales bacterium]HPS49058.1 glucose/galactose MFS transporter [Bacteroidales bacterium]